MIAASVLQTTYCMRVMTSGGVYEQGSSFVYNHDGVQYLVTSANLLKDIKFTDLVDTIELKHSTNGWCKLKMRLVGRSQPNDQGNFILGDDVAVLKSLKNKISTSKQNLQILAIPDSGGVMYNSFAVPGQLVYYLGYPLGLRTERSDVFDGKRVPVILPLVKSGTFSGRFTPMNEGLDYLIIDGNFANGFSGGPVIASLKYMAGAISGRFSEKIGRRVEEIEDYEFMIIGIINGKLPNYLIEGNSDFSHADSGIFICSCFTKALKYILNDIENS